VGQHIVGDDQVGGLALGAQPARQVAAEECGKGAHPGCDRCRCRRRRWVDPEHRDAVGDEVPQHVAVVARDLDYERARAQAQPLDQLQRMRAGMRQERA
jgi:hypothetical protein